ncbi:hypothetical protein V8C86DRAFT_2811197 [Haematococcus lacustris]
MTVNATITLLLVAIWGLSTISNAISLPNCTASLCLVAPGETWTPAALNVSGSLTVAGTPGVRASTLDLSLLSRATFTPGVCQPTHQHCLMARTSPHRSYARPCWLMQAARFKSRTSPW